MLRVEDYFGMEADHAHALIGWAENAVVTEGRLVDFICHKAGAKSCSMIEDRGLPTMFVALPRNGKYGLFILMRAPEPHNRKTTRDEMAFLKRVMDAGYDTAVCHGYSDAVEQVSSYLEI